MVCQLFGVMWVMPGNVTIVWGVREQKKVIVQFFKHGEWCLCVLCGVYGGKGIHGILRTVSLD